jgi:hypothetical protein
MRSSFRHLLGGEVARRLCKPESLPARVRSGLRNVASQMPAQPIARPRARCRAGSAEHRKPLWTLFSALPDWSPEPAQATAGPRGEEAPDRPKGPPSGESNAGRRRRQRFYDSLDHLIDAAFPQLVVAATTIGLNTRILTVTMDFQCLNSTVFSHLKLTQRKCSPGPASSCSIDT